MNPYMSFFSIRAIKHHVMEISKKHQMVAKESQVRDCSGTVKKRCSTSFSNSPRELKITNQCGTTGRNMPPCEDKYATSHTDSNWMPVCEEHV